MRRSSRGHPDPWRANVLALAVLLAVRLGPTAKRAIDLQPPRPSAALERRRCAAPRCRGARGTTPEGSSGLALAHLSVLHRPGGGRARSVRGTVAVPANGMVADVLGAELAPTPYVGVRAGEPVLVAHGTSPPHRQQNSIGTVRRCRAPFALPFGGPPLGVYRFVDRRRSIARAKRATGIEPVLRAWKSA